MGTGYGDSQVFQQDFDRIFSGYRGKRIAVYGTGQNARLIAEYVSGYEIVGFVSRDGSEGILSGQTILSIEEAVKAADILIIAATVSSTRIIYARIKMLIPVGMKVLDMYGEALSGEEAYQENPYWEKNYKALCLEIDMHPVISFDVFDTLIMRTVLKPEDIFEIVGERIGRGIPEGKFKEWRMQAERKCTLDKVAPSFDEIYELLKQEHGLDEETAEQLMGLEIMQEKISIFPRKRMREGYRYAISQGKKVYLTSDMYFSEEQISEFLEQCGIEKRNGLLVSCELGASKQDGSLYGELKKVSGEGRILHIGDNDMIDGVMAEKQGIDSFTILSSYDILAFSSFANIFDCVQTKDDERYLGYFTSILLNDPFVLAGHKGKIPISSYKDIALAIYPMTMMLLNHIMKNAKGHDCIVFPSRDGFFLYELYGQMKSTGKVPNLPDAKYVYASRMSLSQAAVCDEESFAVLLGKLFSDRTINCKEYVKNQFDINLSTEYDAPSGELIGKWGEEGLMGKLKQHCSEAVRKLERRRAAYLDYLYDLGLDKYQSIAMVDIVSFGTQVYCLSQLLNQDIVMLALGTTDVPNAYIRNEQQAFSVYGNVNKEVQGTTYSCSDLSVLHLVLEMLYASTDGQFTGISDDHTPIFQNGTEYDSGLTAGVQEELLKIMEETAGAGIHYENISREFSMGMIRVLLHKYSDIDERLKKQFAFSDPYMGGVKTVNLMDRL